MATGMEKGISRSRVPRIVRTLMVFGGLAVGAGVEAVDFQSEVRTILSDKCFKCHGPAADGRKAGLRLDTQEGSRAAAKSGALPIVPGQPGKSELVARIDSTDADEVMPPPKSKMSLTMEERDLLKRWIQEGASYDTHWAFRPIEKPAIPTLPVDLANMVETPIDAFVLEAMHTHGLRYEPLADPEKRLRRLTFDLTGLPPTLAELESLKVEGDDVNWGRRIEELMSRESFGERMTSEWLDVARYSDTYGYQVDRDRRVWPWRDWVIQAFNSNLPYDQFIQWQLAGDLLKNPTRDQLLATTFNRLHPQKVEGGSVPEEFRIEYVADRLHTFGTAFLGLTLECARCHDHKYDPISQEEYYELSSYFDNIDEAGLYSYFTDSVPTPTLVLTTPEQDQRLQSIEQKISLLEKQFSESLVSEDFKSWMSNLPQEPQIPKPIASYDFETMDGGSIPNLVDDGKPATTSGGNRLVDNGTQGKAIQLTGDDAVNLQVGNFTRNQPFSIATRLFIPEKFERSVVFHRSRAWTDAASRGYEFLIEDGFGQFSLIHFWPGNAISVKTRNPIPIGEWIQIVTTYDGSSRADGLAIYVNGIKADTETIQDSLYKNITGGGGDNIAIGERFRDRGFKNGKVDQFQVYNTQLTELEAAAINLGADHLTRDILNHASIHQISQFAAWRQDSPTRSILDALSAARSERSALSDPIEEIMVMKESRKPHQTYLLDRGNYENRKYPVESSTPGVLPPISSAPQTNRLDLAQWLTSRNHPLTSRVAVNRYWQMIFGRGLVATSEDFGLQGSPPSHPRLLDWLSAEFMDSGWNIQHLLRLMVESRAYNQGSSPKPEKRRLDPNNRWLSYAPSFRLPAEMLRDNALATSGLMVHQVGGEAVRPYEVEQSFKFANRQTGPALYRRSLYTWWKRTGPAPSMIALDASKRDVCTVRRDRTQTPVQAFIYLNDPQFVEAARSLALEFWGRDSASIEDRLLGIFQTLTSRMPTDREVDILNQMYQNQSDHFAQSPENAKAYLRTGDSKVDVDSLEDPDGAAALMAVTSALMAHDECVMKR